MNSLHWHREWTLYSKTENELSRSTERMNSLHWHREWTLYIDTENELSTLTQRMNSLQQNREWTLYSKTENELSRSTERMKFWLLAMYQWYWMPCISFFVDICSNHSRPPSSSRPHSWTGWRWASRSVVKVTTCSTCWSTARTWTISTWTTTLTLSRSRHSPQRSVSLCISRNSRNKALCLYQRKQQNWSIMFISIKNRNETLCLCISINSTNITLDYLYDNEYHCPGPVGSDDDSMWRADWIQCWTSPDLILCFLWQSVNSEAGLFMYCWDVLLLQLTGKKEVPIRQRFSPVSGDSSSDQTHHRQPCSVQTGERRCLPGKQA